MSIENTLLLTGVTGMIGQTLLRTALKKKQFNKIILPVRSIAKAQKICSDLRDSDSYKINFVQTRIEDCCLEQFPMNLDSIIHCACVTQSKEMIIHPVETADSIVIGTKNILEIARKKQVQSMIYLSSMEVYGELEDMGIPVREEQLGSINLQRVRSCYPLGKRMAEHYCYIYYREYGVPVKIARLAQTFGRGVFSADNRVYAQFTRSVLEGKDIILKTPGNSMGNYCALDDTVNGIFTILEKGQNGEVYNVVNEENTMRIREMARLVADQVAGGKIQVRIVPENPDINGYAPDTGLRLSGEKLRNLGWKPRKDLVEMYREMLSEWKGKPQNCSYE